MIADDGDDHNLGIWSDKGLGHFLVGGIEWTTYRDINMLPKLVETEPAGRPFNNR